METLVLERRWALTGLDEPSSKWLPSQGLLPEICGNWAELSRTDLNNVLFLLSRQNLHGQRQEGSRGHGDNAETTRRQLSWLSLSQQYKDQCQFSPFAAFAAFAAFAWWLWESGRRSSRQLEIPKTCTRFMRWAQNVSRRRRRMCFWSRMPCFCPRRWRERRWAIQLDPQNPRWDFCRFTRTSFGDGELQTRACSSHTTIYAQPLPSWSHLAVHKPLGSLMSSNSMPFLGRENSA